MIKNKRYAVSFEVLTYRNGDLHSNKQEFTTMTGEVNTDKQLLLMLGISSKKEQKKFLNLLAVLQLMASMSHLNASLATS